MMRDATTPAGRARELVLRHGWNTTSYQILNAGFDLWFARAGDAVVGHARRKRVWVVGGAPVCPAERLDAVIREFEGAARDVGARVCYVGAQDRLAQRCLPDPAYSGTILGAEPWWDPADWPKVVAGRASVRAQLNRARNKGVTVALLAAGATAPGALHTVLAEWLATKGLPPLGFLTSPWLLGDLDDRRIFVAEQRGHPVGFLVLTPVPGRRGWLVEQIVRGHRTQNGTAELLVDSAFRWMAAEGARYASLGLAPLAPTPSAASLPTPWWLRLTTSWLRAHGRRFYNFDGLYAFKAKLGPAGWDPVYAIANEGRLSLPTMLGVGEAVVGGDLLGFGARMIRHALRHEARSLLRRG
jgi:phosphatidylglycerol lysyltransferase